MYVRLTLQQTFNTAAIECIKIHTYSVVAPLKQHYFFYKAQLTNKNRKFPVLRQLIYLARSFESPKSKI